MKERQSACCLVTVLLDGFVERTRERSLMNPWPPVDVAANVLGVESLERTAVICRRSNIASEWLDACQMAPLTFVVVGFGMNLYEPMAGP